MPTVCLARSVATLPRQGWVLSGWCSRLPAQLLSSHLRIGFLLTGLAVTQLAGIQEGVFWHLLKLLTLHYLGRCVT